MKYLTLIRTITLLHQHQRPQKEKAGLHYIEVEVEDIKAANTSVIFTIAKSPTAAPP